MWHEEHGIDFNVFTRKEGGSAGRDRGGGGSEAADAPADLPRPPPPFCHVQATHKAAFRTLMSWRSLELQQPPKAHTPSIHSAYPQRFATALYR